MDAPNTCFSIIAIVVFLKYKYVHQCTCPRLKASPKKCWSRVQNLLQMTLLAFQILRWLSDFFKILDPYWQANAGSCQQVLTAKEKRSQPCNSFRRLSQVTNIDLWEWPQMKQQSHQNGPSHLPLKKARQICSVWRARWLFCNIYGFTDMNTFILWCSVASMQRHALKMPYQVANLDVYFFVTERLQLTAFCAWISG